MMLSEVKCNHSRQSSPLMKYFCLTEIQKVDFIAYLDQTFEYSNRLLLSHSIQLN
jgi:hypothetical protein